MTKKQELLEFIDWSIDDNQCIEMIHITNGRRIKIIYSVSQLMTFVETIKNDYDDNLNFIHESVKSLNTQIISWGIYYD